MEFQVGIELCSVSPWKEVSTFWQTGRAEPQNDGTLSSVGNVRAVAYKLELPQELGRGLEFTWEREDQFQKKYPHLFTKTAPSSSIAS
ncbi:hypothetical protein Tco_0576444 [Tanacetum coccineum]